MFALFIVVGSLAAIVLTDVELIPTNLFVFFAHSAQVDGELLRNQAKLMSSVACCGVPIVTVVVGNSYGMESYMMV